jgi:hypothetical protein
MDNPQFFLSRTCFREPIPQIAEAAILLGQAADSHLADDRVHAGALIRQANIEALRDWTDSIWGRHNHDILRIRKVEGAGMCGLAT